MRYAKPIYGRCKASSLCVMCKLVSPENNKTLCAPCAEQEAVRKRGKKRIRSNNKVPIELLDFTLSAKDNAAKLGIKRTSAHYWLTKLKTT